MSTNGHVITVRGLSKKFNIFHEPPFTLQKAVHNYLAGRKNFETVWAVKALSFSVGKGETLGIIGPNASGKTTLLRLLAGIYTPTEGDIRVTGRIAPSLELGSGFLTEFTAVENLYLYGAVFGLTRSQVAARLAPIAEFSGLGRFMDVPVRQYSFGMRMRLAFSFAVTVEPDILLIDEMLAVGDLSFKEKCFAKLAGLKASGMTLVLVSHHMEEISLLCDRVLLLEGGALVAEGSGPRMIEEYKKRCSR